MSGAIAARRGEQEVEWGPVDWEALRVGYERVRAVLSVLRCGLDDASRLEGASDALVRAITVGSTDALTLAAHDLAGLGEGSTPAGDDFLVGAMYALRAALPEARAAELCQVIAEAAVPRTTSSSAQWLQRANGGEAIPTWSFFLSSLAGGDTSQIREAAQGVLALGHTSGRAALAGFVATAEVLIGERA